MHTYNTPYYSQQNQDPSGETEFGYENESFEGEDENLLEYEADNEYENDQEADYESTFSETNLNELAGEMPVGENEEELDHFIHRLLKRTVGHRRMSADAHLERRLRKLLKGLVRKLFGSNKGAHRFTHSTGEVNSLQSEVFGNENEFEVRKKFIRMAGNAGRRAFQMGRQNSPDARIRLALKNAARKHFPALLRLKKYHRDAKQLAVRLGRIENSLIELTEKIAAIHPNAGDSAVQGKPESSAQNDSPEANNSEYENLYNEDYEDNEFESEENEYEDNEYEENEYEENEYEDNEYEENESEENEYEENEDTENGVACKLESCGCTFCKDKSPRKKKSPLKKEYEDNEDNEYEDNEYEENENEENENEEYEYEENEYEENEYEENEFESETNDRELTFNETMQMELASELLAVQSEDELDQFLGKLIKKAARAVSKIAKSAVPGPLGGFLKKMAKKVLPIAGGIIGGAFVPGMGNIIGKKLGSTAANLFELELEGLSAEDREYENAKAFVRFAGNAIRRSALLPRKHPPVRRAKIAVRHAARRYAPGLLRRGRMNRQRPNKFHRRPLNHSRQQWKKHHHPNYPQGRRPQQFNGQQQPYAQNPNLSGDENANQFQDYPDYSGNDTNTLNTKMDGLEKIIQQLNEKISALNPDNNQQNDSDGNAGHHLDSAGSGNESGSDNEYWN